MKSGQSSQHLIKITQMKKMWDCENGGCYEEKFQDYWNISCLTLYVPVILNPRFKYSYVKFRFVQAFGDEANNKLSEVKKAIE